MLKPGASQDAAAEVERRRVGFCVDYRHRRIVESSGGRRYYLWELSFRRAEYPKYPSVRWFGAKGMVRDSRPFRLELGSHSQR